VILCNSVWLALVEESNLLVTALGDPAFVVTLSYHYDVMVRPVGPSMGRAQGFLFLVHSIAVPFMKIKNRICFSDLRQWCSIAMALHLVLIVSGKETAAAQRGDPANNYGFERPINPDWFPHDARQWSGYDRSTLLTDLGKGAPSAVLSTQRREKGKWHVLPYETAGYKGKALSIYPFTEPPPLRLPLGVTGLYAVYIGLSTTANSTDRLYEGNSIRAKLGSAKVYRRLANNLKIIEPKRDVIAEQLLIVTEISKDETVEIASFPLMPATVTHVRLVPITEAERRAWLNESTTSKHRTSIATNDGHSWIWPYRPREEADLLQPFESFQNTDFAQWWHCPLGADLVSYPSKIGTLGGEGTYDFFRPLDEEYTRSLQALIAKGLNPLLVARQAAKRLGQEFHFVVRPQGFGASMPYEETFNSKFYRDHPEWRCVDREGRQAMYMSYAVPEVRRRVLDVIREAVEISDPDGVGFFFNRGVPLMLWEKAFADRFRSEFGIDIMMVEAEDSRIYKLRGKIMTEYLRELRLMLDDLQKLKGGKRYAISATTFTRRSINEPFGLDVETWVKEGLIDQIAVASAKTNYDNGELPPDMAYYHKIIAGTKIRIFPMVTAWNVTAWNKNAPLEDFCKAVVRWYQDGADGVVVWDPENGAGFRYNPAEGDSLDLLRYLGHRELIAYWAEHGVPRPNAIPILKLGENEYSQWVPNRGY